MPVPGHDKRPKKKLPRRNEIKQIQIKKSR